MFVTGVQTCCSSDLAHSGHFSIPAFTELTHRPAREVVRVFKGEWPVGLLNPEVKEKFRQKWGGY
jgi:hypothetical protein